MVTLVRLGVGEPGALPGLTGALCRLRGPPRAPGHRDRRVVVARHLQVLMYTWTYVHTSDSYPPNIIFHMDGEVGNGNGSYEARTQAAANVSAAANGASAALAAPARAGLMTRAKPAGGVGGRTIAGLIDEVVVTFGVGAAVRGDLHACGVPRVSPRSRARGRDGRRDGRRRRWSRSRLC